MAEPEFLDEPPTAPTVTDYDLAHSIVYLRLLDAATDGADWREVARLVLERDPDRDPDRVHHMHASHLARARWMTEHGYRDLLRRADAH
ncbi:DNA -binding domain-containing protein [Pararhizobium mangrovi]|uniref:DUF2285 domain-containing protein n=1 Tax=Pararhizobium mangrovi TaxID=2590452 RepID=A0A506U1S3_9HYPH|nr:DUF2285 domain-containing protein [Pararhizobium mangrovi]TPW27710.1 DUF2285 domain-containing protein [Pararhizobium mangrovi]